jgi:uncharacterized protein YjbI with pentapeptide repeats
MSIAILLCTFGYSRLATAEESRAQKVPLTREEALDLVKRGQAIENRMISSQVLEALVLAASRQQSDRTRGPELEIVNSIVHDRILWEKREVQPGIKFERTEFLDDVDWENVNFSSPVSFRDCNFRRQFLCKKSVLKDNTRFVGCRFDGRCNCSGSVFGSQGGHGAHFEDCVFQESALFEFASFFRLQFKSTTVQGDTNFSEAQLNGPSAFVFCQFEHPVIFREARVNAVVAFGYATFNSDASFTAIDSGEKGHLTFGQTKFMGDITFAGSRLDTLRFRTGEGFAPCVFEKSAIFTRLNCRIGDFSGAQFVARANFTDANFRELAEFRGTVFEGDADFYRATFPAIGPDSSQHQGLVLDDVIFAKAATLSWSQLAIGGKGPGRKTKVITNKPETWAVLEDVFHRNNDLSSQNEAHYQKRLLSMNSEKTINYKSLSDRVSWLFWGFGVRPLRLLLWILVVYALFALVYWTQTHGMQSKNEKHPSLLARIRFASNFTLRNSFGLFYGFDRSRTWLFKTITLLQAVLSKIMLLFLLQALANVSPLLRDLFGKLIPV